MSKTIEKLARQYAEDMCPVGDYCGGVYDEQRNSDLPIYADDAKSVLSWLFGKPLASRMTAEEKERVKRTLNMYYDKWRVHPNEATEAVYCAIKETFQAMFGQNFFKEEE